MKKICFCLALLSTILLLISPGYAQVPRQPTSSEGKTTYTNIAVVGLDNDGTSGNYNVGTPAYIEMTSCAGEVFYLYIGYDGKLRQASEEIIGYLASPATVGWHDASAVIVGNQKP